MEKWTADAIARSQVPGNSLYKTSIISGTEFVEVDRMAARLQILADNAPAETAEVLESIIEELEQ